MGASAAAQCGRQRRRTGAPAGGLLTAVLLALAARPAPGLINPRFTPVHLVEQSGLILRVRLSPAGKAGRLKVEVLKAVKGKAAQEGFAIDLTRTDAARAAAFRKRIGDRHRTGLLFTGRYREEGGEAEPDNGVTGLLHVCGRWHRLYKPQRAAVWLFDTEESRMEACFAGGTDMLGRMVDYILSDPRAFVPVTDGVGWRRPERIGRVAGTVHGAAVVDPAGEGRWMLFVLSEGGDRLWRRAEDGRFDDVGGRLKLASRSAAAAWGDFTGSGRLDLLSWDRAAWTLWSAAPNGTLKPTALPLRTKGPCLHVAALDGGGRRCCALISTPGMPILLRPRDEGGWDETPLSADAGGYEKAAAPLGRAAACLAADLDGDHAADVLQPFERGVVIFPGRSPGRFGRPVASREVGAGPGRAAAFVGDYDADGLLDVFCAGEGGCRIWQNRGRLRFEEALHHSGEAAYITKPMASGGATCDVTNDGRQDFLVRYADRAPQVFFNRGFRSFGHAHGLDVQENELLTEAEKGTRAGAVADLDGDGAQDMVVVLPDGAVWAFLREPPAGAAPSLAVALPPDGPLSGPVTVTGWQARRCLGAWNVRRGTSEAFFARDVKGPITVRWALPGGKTQEKKVIVLKPTRFVLPIGGGKAGR